MRANPNTAEESSGSLLQPHTTPDNVEMKEGDTVDAFSSQSGGAMS